MGLLSQNSVKSEVLESYFLKLEPYCYFYAVFERKQFLRMNPFSKNCPYNWGLMTGRPPLKEAPPFGRKLSALRKEQGLSQQKLAELLGTTRNAVDYYERRATNPTLDLIQKCADTLGVSPEYFLDDDSGKPRKRGPKSVLEKRFEQVSKLPRGKQREILKVVDALLAQAS